MFELCKNGTGLLDHVEQAVAVGLLRAGRCRTLIGSESDEAVSVTPQTLRVP
jgi:hypothetical protein